MEIISGMLAGPAPEGRSELWRVLAGAAMASLRLTSAGACDPAERGTRLGGVPLVGPGFVWPRSRDGRPLCLLGQLNGTEINTALGEDRLPAGTLLSFFYDAEEWQGSGYDPDHDQYWRVVAADAAYATAAPVPVGAWTFRSFALRPERVVTVPDIEEPPVHDLVDADLDGVYQLYEQLDPGIAEPWHRVLGWPDLVQNPMQLECQLASNGIWVGGPEGYQDPRVPELAPGAADWALLWQLDSDDAPGWMWGDGGKVYYWIRRQDLAAGRFDRVWMVFQCF